MKLSEKAKNDLIKILLKDLEPGSVEMLNDEEINHLGVFLLSIFAESLKMKNSSKSI